MQPKYQSETTEDLTADDLTFGARLRSLRKQRRISLVGLAWPWISKLPLGRLPGDILIERPGFRLFLPITTMIVISVLISLILMLFRK